MAAFAQAMSPAIFWSTSSGVEEQLRRESISLEIDSGFPGLSDVMKVSVSTRRPRIMVFCDGGRNFFNQSTLAPSRQRMDETVNIWEYAWSLSPTPKKSSRKDMTKEWKCVVHGCEPGYTVGLKTKCGWSANGLGYPLLLDLKNTSVMHMGEVPGISLRRNSGGGAPEFSFRKMLGQ